MAASLLAFAAGVRAEAPASAAGPRGFAYLVIDKGYPDEPALRKFLADAGAVPLFSRVHRSIVLIKEEQLIMEGPESLWTSLDKHGSPSYWPHRGCSAYVHIRGIVLWGKGFLDGGDNGYSAVIDHRISNGITEDVLPLSGLVDLIAKTGSEPSRMVKAFIGSAISAWPNAHVDVQAFFNGETSARLKFSVTGKAADVVEDAR